MTELDLALKPKEPIVPWDFQIDAIDDLTEVAGKLFETMGRVRLLLQAATGAGKTVIASRIIDHATSSYQHVLFLAHRREIVDQTVDKLAGFGVTSGVIMSGEPWDASRLVNTASIQTLHSWAVRRKRVAPPKAKIIFIDECHHYNSSKTWQEVIALYPDANIIGMTATPINRRGRGLGHHFDAMVKCPTIKWLTEHGYLVPARYFAPSPVDLKGLRVIAGDYVESELEKRMDAPKLVGDIVENWGRYGQNRQTMVFASGVKHSMHLAEQFNKIGVKAAHIDGETPKHERDQIVRDFKAERIKVLCNCAVFTEGTDIPSIGCLVFARPTKSLLLYLQVIGRGLRAFLGKKDLLVLDHAGVVYEHGPADQDWEWRLDYGEGDVRQATEANLKLKKEITCGGCKAVYWGKLHCPECGWAPVMKGREIKTYDAYLQALDEIANPPALDKQTFYRMLLGLAVEKKQKPGAAFYRYQEKFGERPPYSWKDLSPLEPNVEVKAFVNKQIRTYFWKKDNPGLAGKLPGGNP